jgi:hypothetical protein
MIAHGTSTAGERHHGAKLTEEDILQIRSLGSGHSLSELSKMFGVSRSNISLILRGDTWSHLASARE